MSAARREQSVDNGRKDLWDMLQDEGNWSNRMVPATYAFHVTNVPAEVLFKNIFKENIML